MKNKKIIEVKKLTKKYNKNTAVNEITFDVYEGEVFGLLGPNGAGKTTTLEIIETLRQKTSGEVTVAGLSLDQSPKKIKNLIGIQLQHSNYYPRATLSQLLDLFAGLYKTEVNKKELLEEFDLTSKANDLYDTLSGGQQQRFSIATTLINKPKIIFLDEPSTGLDPQARRNLWEVIKKINSNGTTVVLTTHYMEEAEYLCDRVGIMDNGKIIAIDEPSKLIKGLLADGFKKPQVVAQANLEDVFINLTGKDLRDK